MRWFKREMWKVGIAVAGMLLLLVLMVWVPVSAAGAYEGVSGLATPVTATVQASPTEDATVTALNKEKLVQEVDQLKNQNYWAWTTIGSILVGFAGLLAALYSFITWIRNRQDEQKKRDEEQKRWLDDRQAERERGAEEQQRWLEDRKDEREKRAEERFQAVVEGLGSVRNEAKIGAAITLRTFLRPGYQQFYTQTFDLAVAHLRLRNVDPNVPEPLDTLSQVLITIFKESFPLARDRLKVENSQFRPQSLVARHIQLDSAYLVEADLKQVWMPQASLRKIDLSGANLSGANLSETNLSGANLSGANLSGAILKGAVLNEANLYNANLNGASLEDAKLNKTMLCEANLCRATFSGASLHGAVLDRADLHETNLSGSFFNRTILCGANLSGANLYGINLNGSDLRLANLNGANLSVTTFDGVDLRGASLNEVSPEIAQSFRNANVQGVKGLTKEQLAICKAKGAIIDEDSTISSPQSTVSPPLPSQSNGVQAPSVPPTRGSTPTSDTDGNSTTFSKPSNNGQAPSAPPAQESTPTSGTDESSATSSRSGSQL